MWCMVHEAVRDAEKRLMAEIPCFMQHASFIMHHQPSITLP